MVAGPVWLLVASLTLPRIPEPYLGVAFFVSNPRGILRASLWVEHLPAMWQAFLLIEVPSWIVVLEM
jgi:hypothetical protein